MDIFGALQMVITSAILAVLYYRMVKREVPQPVGALQAILPIVLGGAMYYGIIPYMILLSNAGLLKTIVGGTHGLLGSFLKAFVVAAFPEETLKGLMMLLTVFLFRKKIRNVYEYILIGAAIGLGFTIVEDFGYISDGANPLRILFLGGHSAMDMLMGLFLGMARYKIEHNQGPATKDKIAAFCVPVLWHTLFDMFTAMNPAFEHINDMGAIDAVYFGIAAVVGIGSVVLQVMIFKRAKRDCAKYCGMTFAAAGGSVPAQELERRGRHSRR